MEEIKVGDYCIAGRWSDLSPCDPWYVGFVEEVKVYPTHLIYLISGGIRGFRQCKKVTPELGDLICQVFPKLEELGWTPNNLDVYLSGTRRCGDSDWLTVKLLKELKNDLD